MGNIKIDEVEFYTFLNIVDSYIRESSSYAPEEIKNNANNIKKLIRNYQYRSELKIKRKAYYDFYINNRYINPTEAKEAYKKYLQIKEEIEKQE